MLCREDLPFNELPGSFPPRIMGAMMRPSPHGSSRCLREDEPTSRRSARDARGARILLLALASAALLGGCLDRDERSMSGSRDAAKDDSTSVAATAARNETPRSKKPTSARAPDTVYFYMSPRGHDADPGSRERPVATLARVHQLLQQRAPDADVVVKVRSDAGTYLNQTVLWTYYRPERSITIESDPPAINARFAAGDDPPASPFFGLSAMRGEPTNIILRRLTVSDYVSRAVLFLGDRETRANWNGHNAIENCVFERIGNARSPMRAIVYSAIGVVNSRNNRIVNCAFTDIKNHTLANFPQDRRDAGYEPPAFVREEEKRLRKIGPGSNPNIPIVCIYLAHYSDSNVVDGCDFKRIKGDVVRIRDDSNSNVIKNNSFELAGWNAIVSMWQCDSPKQNCMKEFGPEMPSTGNAVLFNRAAGNWRGGMPLLYIDLRAQQDPSGDRTMPLLRHVAIEGNTLEAYR